MLGKLWSWIIAALALVAGALWWLLGRANARAAKAERQVGAMQGRRRTEKQAEQARKKAKEKGDANVDKAVDRARAGKRDHFE